MMLFAAVGEPEVAAMILLIILIGLIVLPIVFLPTIIAYNRGHQHLLAIFLVNFLLGGFFVGWAVALIWAIVGEKALGRYQHSRRREMNPSPFDEQPVVLLPPQSSHVVYTCPHCRRGVQVFTQTIGSVVSCGACGQQFTTTPIAMPVQ